MSMINNWTNMMFQNFSYVNVEMPSIEELIVFESMKLSFRNKEFHHLRILTLETVIALNFQEVKIPMVESIFIIQCKLVIFSKNCEFNQNKEKGLVIKIINSDDVIFDCKMNNVKELVVIQSERIIVTCDEPQLMKKYQVLSTLFFNNDDYEQYDKEINIRQMLEDEENNSDTFVLHPFISYSSRFDMKNNTIVELFKADKRNVKMVVPHLFYTDQNKHFPFNHKVRNGETIETKSITNFRCCEVTVEDVSIISLGLLDETQFEVKSETHVEWMKGTIGHHSDDGEIY